jgi:vacuolar protein sorting-associated protein 13A/C
VEEDDKRAQAAKREKLVNAELLSGPGKAGMSLEEERKNDSFFTSFLAGIVTNIELEVRPSQVYQMLVSVYRS